MLEDRLQDMTLNLRSLKFSELQSHDENIHCQLASAESGERKPVSEALESGSFTESCKEAINDSGRQVVQRGGSISPAHWSLTSNNSTPRQFSAEADSSLRWSTTESCVSTSRRVSPEPSCLLADTIPVLSSAGQNCPPKTPTSVDESIGLRAHNVGSQPNSPWQKSTSDLEIKNLVMGNLGSNQERSCTPEYESSSAKHAISALVAEPAVMDAPQADTDACIDTTTVTNDGKNVPYIEPLKSLYPERKSAMTFAAMRNSKRIVRGVRSRFATSPPLTSSVPTFKHDGSASPPQTLLGSTASISRSPTPLKPCMNSSSQMPPARSRGLTNFAVAAPCRSNVMDLPSLPTKLHGSASVPLPCGEQQITTLASPWLVVPPRAPSSISPRQGLGSLPCARRSACTTPVDTVRALSPILNIAATSGAFPGRQRSWSTCAFDQDSGNSPKQQSTIMGRPRIQRANSHATFTIPHCATAPLSTCIPSWHLPVMTA